MSPVEIIADPADPRVAPYRDLPRLDSRVPEGLFVAEGSLVVRRLIAGRRFPLRSILTTPAALPLLLAHLPVGLDPPLYVAPAGLMRAVAGYAFHRGCIALAERGPDPDPAPLIAVPGPRRLVVLDEVSDPDNVGAIFRTATGLGVQGVLLSPGATDPLYRKAIRVSAGTSLCLPYGRIDDWPADLWRLREAGYTLLALTPDEEAMDVVELARAGPIPGRLALLLGSESSGLSAALRREADLRVRIAMAPGLDSLNVAVASAIALHRLLRP